ncbi:unnamed protein product [Ambrosiozyma monospora]|uniref:Unnamed protein product n=1 Tax=Ambrosiozyma monospora TaxID=43982 RepID=A0ACB5U4I5_AMBMO|nr:unnamed protein product [Ambrosiozyma monospora]
MRFLIAEDNLVNQEVVKRMLKLEGFTNVTLACDGDDAVQIVKEQLESTSTSSSSPDPSSSTPDSNTNTDPANKEFDLIFMDVQMPKMDGLTATKIIRSKYNYKGPIVALTAFADKSNQDDCLLAGMSGFLSKPIRRNLLKKVILKFCPQVSGTGAGAGSTGESSVNGGGGRRGL